MNLAALTKRIEALEEQHKAETPKRWVRRIWEDGKQIGGYTGPITEDINVIDRIVIRPIPLLSAVEN